MRLLSRKIWPYYILERDDEQLKNDLQEIVDFISADCSIDVVIFIPNAGLYLNEMFTSIYGSTYKTGFITIRRVISTSKPGWLKNYVFKRRTLSNIMRHVEVMLRLAKVMIKLKSNRRVEKYVGSPVKERTVLIIDDSVDTGTTMEIAKDVLRNDGAAEVKTACISNHLIPRKVKVDYSVYEYALLRTKNSKDYADK